MAARLLDRTTLVPLLALLGVLGVVGCSGASDETLSTPAPDPTPAAVTVASEAPSTPPATAASPTPLAAPSSSAPPTAMPSEPASPGASPAATAESGIHTSVVVEIPLPAATTAPTPAAASVTQDAAETPEPTLGAHVPAESIDTEDKRLNVTVGGKTTYIRNGGRVELGDGLAVEVYLDPYPPTTLHAVLDLYLTRDGEPVDDASIDVEFDMLSMAHGPFVATAKKIGGGHHLTTLDYIMFGAWDQFVTVRRDLERIRFPLVIVAYP